MSVREVFEDARIDGPGGAHVENTDMLGVKYEAGAVSFGNGTFHDLF